MNIVGTASGGMQEAQSKFEKSAERIAGAAAPTPDCVDLSTDMIDMLSARNQFQTNARVLQTADEMQKKLIDIFA